MKERINYIDYLKGLSVTWVVWYHTEHPAFVDYSFRIPLFFLVSGIFFKAYSWNVFWRKKVNQLVIPFILFYIIYYAYLIGINYLKFGSLTTFNYASFWEIFNCHKGYESFTVNPPLWFICSLINLQLLLYLCIHIFKKRWILICVAAGITLIGKYYIEDLASPFMIGRCLPYFLYYALGYTLGKPILNYIKHRSNEIKLITASFTIFFIIMAAKHIFTIENFHLFIIDYLQIITVILLLMILFKNTYKIPVFYPLKYFGLNSYIVLGMHEIYQTTFRILFENIFGTMNITLGVFQTCLTLICLWPTICLFNKYIPCLVAKKEFIPIPKQ